jgi:Domain of unknown function (DUF5655)
MWHACGPYTVEGFLDNKPPGARALFEGFVALVNTCGPVRPAPAKTRVAFMTRTRFASVNHLTDREMRIHFVLPSPIDNSRIYKIDQFGKWYVHNVRITQLEQLDDELRGWLCQSYQQMGR